MEPEVLLINGFNHFFNERQQYNLIKESESSLKAISHGAHKVAFGLLLFILYINDIHNSVKNCKIHH